MFKRLMPLFLVFIIIFAISGCANTSKAEKVTVNENKIKVVVSFNPLREFAEAVGGDKVEVLTMVPEGTEPHDFEPKAKDLEALSNSKIFVYNGLGMEGWTQKVIETVNNKELVVVDSSKNVEAIKSDEEDNHEEEEEEEHGEYDPHIWLGLLEAKVQSANIRDALVQVDGANKNFYEENYNEFAAKLDGLYNEYRSKFDKVSNKNFVTGHAAFAYLCRNFGLEQNSVEGVFSEGEPTTAKMRDLIDYSKKNNVKTIFMEELASPQVSETIAREVGAKVQKIYTIESKEDGRNYLDAMRENLERIYTSLK